MTSSVWVCCKREQENVAFTCRTCVLSSEPHLVKQVLVLQEEIRQVRFRAIHCRKNKEHLMELRRLRRLVKSKQHTIQKLDERVHDLRGSITRKKKVLDKLEESLSGFGRKIGLTRDAEYLLSVGSSFHSLSRLRDVSHALREQRKLVCSDVLSCFSSLASISFHSDPYLKVYGFSIMSHIVSQWARILDILPIPYPILSSYPEILIFDIFGEKVFVLSAKQEGSLAMKFLNENLSSLKFLFFKERNGSQKRRQLSMMALQEVFSLFSDMLTSSTTLLVDSSVSILRASSSLSLLADHQFPHNSSPSPSIDFSTPSPSLLVTSSNDSFPDDIFGDGVRAKQNNYEWTLLDDESNR